MIDHPTTNVSEPEPKEKREEFLTWLAEYDGWKVPFCEVEEEFPELEFNFIGVTYTIGDDGEKMIPKRDYRQYVKFGHTID